MHDMPIFVLFKPTIIFLSHLMERLLLAEKEYTMQDEHSDGA